MRPLRMVCVPSVPMAELMPSASGGSDARNRMLEGAVVGLVKVKVVVLLDAAPLLKLAAGKVFPAVKLPATPLASVRVSCRAQLAPL